MKRLSYFQSCSIFLKVHKQEIILNFFYINPNLLWHWLIFEKKFDVRTFPRRLSISGTKIFWRAIKKNFFRSLWYLRGVPIDSLSKFRLIVVEICILISYFWVISKNYSMGLLSIRGNDFIAHWAYEEMISSHTESTPWEFSRILSQQKNINNFYMYIHGEHTRKWFHRTVSIQGNDLNPGWAYAEMISLHPEHMRKSNMIFKNLVFQALGPIRFRFLKKSKKNFMHVYL